MNDGIALHSGAGGPLAEYVHRNIAHSNVGLLTGDVKPPAVIWMRVTTTYQTVPKRRSAKGSFVYLADQRLVGARDAGTLICERTSASKSGNADDLRPGHCILVRED